MISSSKFAGAELFNQDGTLKKMEITAYDDENNVIAEIKNEDIHFESFELTESICSEKELRFGCCEASSVKFKCSNVNASMKNKKITVDVSITDSKFKPDMSKGFFVANLISQTGTDGGRLYYALDLAHYAMPESSEVNILIRFDKIPTSNPGARFCFVVDGTAFYLQEDREGVSGQYAIAENYDVFTTYSVTVALSNRTPTGFLTKNTLADEKLRIGTYYVDNVRKLNERRFLEVTAYDVMYKILNADVTSWYDTAMQNLPMTVADLRNSFFTYITGTLGLLVTQETTTLANDSITLVRKYIDTTDGKTVVKGSDIIIPICEINGVFGHVGRDNVFHYIALEAGEISLFPANDLYPDDDLYPDSIFANVDCDDVKYITSYYEDFYTVPIDGVTIIDTHNDRIGRSYHVNPKNFYKIEDNLITSSTNDNLTDIAFNLLLAIYKISYIPHETKAIGNPCYEVGDAIRYRTRFKQVESYILQRRLTGIQAMKDTIIADGEEYYQ